MRKIFFILFLFSVTAKAQTTYIVMNKVVRDSLLIKLHRDFREFLDSNKIDLDPVRVKANVFILNVDQFTKGKWPRFKSIYDSKIAPFTTIRVLTQAEQDSIVARRNLIIK